MDHRVIPNTVLLKAAAWGLLLIGLFQTPVTAQITAPPDAVEASGAVTRPAPAPARPLAARQAAASRLAVRPGEDGSDDPESRPVAAYDRPRAAEPVEDPGSLAISILGKTGLVVALMLVCAAGWKRLRVAAPLGGLQPAQAVQVTSTVPLGPQRFLHLVTAGRHQLLVGSSPQSVSLIAVLEGGSRMAPEGEARATARGPSMPGLPSEDDAWSQGPEAPADRFEELLLRLRDLETGPYESAPAASRPAAGRVRESREPDRADPRAADVSQLGAARAAGPRYERDSGPRVEIPMETGWMGRAGGESAPSVRGEEPDRPLSPGTLFRTSRSAGIAATRRQGETDA